MIICELYANYRQIRHTARTVLIDTSSRGGFIYAILIAFRR